MNDWFTKRCTRCVFWNGDRTCTRSGLTDPVPVREDCRIRMYQKGPWRDAFMPRSIGAQLFHYQNVRPRQMSKQDLRGVIKEVNKATKAKGFDGMVGFMDDFDDGAFEYPRLPTGLPSLNRLLGGGIPLGITGVIAGKPGAGKTAVALQSIGHMMQEDPEFVAYYEDAEARLEKQWALHLGIDPQRLLLGRHETLEDALTSIEGLIKSEACPASLFIFDSLDANLPRGRFQTKKGKQRDIDDDDVALKARLMSDYYPRVMHAIRKYHRTLLFVAQLRTANIGTFARNDFSGGNAIKHYDTIELGARMGAKKTWPTDGEDNYVGHTTHFELLKASLSGVRPHDEAVLTFFDGEGFNSEYDLVSAAIAEGFFDQGGGWTRFDDIHGTEQKVQGTKPVLVFQKLQEEGLWGAFYAAYTGEVPAEAPTKDKQAKSGKAA